MIQPLAAPVVETKLDLGVFVDSSLKFHKLSAAAAAKANQILEVITRLLKLIDISTLPPSYTALIRSHLEYGNVAWDPFNCADQLLMNVSKGKQRAW